MPTKRKEEEVVPGFVPRAALLAGVPICCLVALLEHPGVTQALPGWCLLCTGVLAVAVAAAALRFPLPDRRAQSVGLAFGLLLWMVVASLASIYPFATRVSMAAWLGGVGIMTAIAIGVRQRREWRMTAHALVAIATLISLVGFDQWLGDVGDHPKSALMRATFSNSDCFAVIPLCGLFICSGLLPSARRFAQVFLCAESLVLCGAVLASGSRAGLLGCSVAMVTFLGTILSRRRWSSMTSVLVALVPLLVVVPLLFFGGLLMPTWGRLQGLVGGEDDQGIVAREDVLLYGFRTALAHPLLGTGPGTFDLAYQKHRPLSAVLPSYIYVNRAHDDFVEIAVEDGLPALALWIALLGTVVFRGCRFAVKGAMSPEAASSAAAVIGVAAYSSLNFAISVPADLFFWFACMGLAVSIPVHKDVEPDAAPAGPMLAVVLACGGLLSVMMGWHVGRVNLMLARASADEQGLRFESALDTLSQALSLEPGRAELYERKARVEQRLALLRSNKELQASALADLNKAVSLEPSNQELLMLTAEYLSRQGDFAGAEKSLETAAKAAPYRDEILEELLRLHMEQNSPIESLETMKELAMRDGSRRKDLAKLLEVVETMQPGKGGEALERWARDPRDRNLSEEVGRGAVDQLLDLKRPKQAELLLRSLDRIEPNDTGLMLCRARAEQELNHPAQALALLDTVLSHKEEEAYADYQQALEYWAQLMKKKGATEAVALRLAEHLTRNPDHAGVRQALVDTYLGMNHVEQARVLLEEGLQQDPDNTEFLVRRGKLYQREGSADMATQYYRRAMQRDPSNAEAIQGLKALGQL